MAISDYSSLQTAVTNWSGGRTDIASRIPEGVALTEAKINRKLRTKDMETKNSSFAVSSEYVSVPTGFGGVTQFYLNTTPLQILELMPGDVFTNTFQDGSSGKPRAYCIEAANFRFGQVPDTSYTATLIYYLQVPALSGSNTTNWLLTSHPDAYLYGTLAEMCGWARDFDGAKAWETMMYQVLQEIVSISNKDKWSGGSITMRPA